ncbi:hypothetical protein GO009_15615 [Muricauda sp. TY007]|nr:hypothetical protein [Muricauda sp. TY007]
MKHIQRLRKMVRMAVNNEWLEKYPLDFQRWQNRLVLLLLKLCSCPYHFCFSVMG